MKQSIIKAEDDFMKKTLQFFYVICVLALCLGCETQSTVNASFDVIDDPDAVVVGPVDVDGETYLRLPVSLFGSESTDVSGSVADIYLNGGLVMSTVNLADYIHDDDTVRFSLSPVTSDDTIGIQITFSTSATVYYEGTISDEGEVEMVLSVM